MSGVCVGGVELAVAGGGAELVVAERATGPERARRRPRRPRRRYAERSADEVEFGADVPLRSQLRVRLAV